MSTVDFLMLRFGVFKGLIGLPNCMWLGGPNLTNLAPCEMPMIRGAF